MNTNPMMIYFGQELGEPGMESEGFSGRDGRTTIFDYWSIDSIRRWNNHGRYNEHLLNAKEKGLRHFLWYGRINRNEVTVLQCVRCRIIADRCAWHALGYFTERNPKDEYTD